MKAASFPTPELEWLWWRIRRIVFNPGRDVTFFRQADKNLECGLGTKGKGRLPLRDC
jgi:hypothetical protein